MRKIESQMIDAINANKNWKSANTEVRTDDNNESRVFLHGNHIATVTDDDMMIMDGGWQSNTTKSRLNALCDAFCIAGECVFQKDFVWYVRHFAGKINGKDVFKTNKFYNGYRFAWSSYLNLYLTLYYGKVFTQKTHYSDGVLSVWTTQRQQTFGLET